MRLRKTVVRLLAAVALAASVAASAAPLGPAGHVYASSDSHHSHVTPAGIMGQTTAGC